MTVARLLLAVFWCVWAYPFVFRAPHIQKRGSVTRALPTGIGLLLECAAIFIALAFRLPPGAGPGAARLVPALLLGPVAAVLSWTAVQHLGRQFRVAAGLYEDHALVREGPYSVVRHPIYSSLFAMLLSTGLILTPWTWLAVSVALFAAGTEIRVRTEDSLLASRFGAAFELYRKSVPAWLPFVR
jgi:protein-S-isoprenylcysteine O-methyltransferase Ste14